MRPRRALLYVPGDDLRKIHKAAELGSGTAAVDCICLDLEDGVAFQRKDEARRLIPQALHERDFGRAERLVRVNAATSGWMEEDLKLVLPAHPQGIVLPKVQSEQDIQLASRIISQSEQQHQWPAGEIALLAIIESAPGVLNLAQIAAANARLQALALGAEDLAEDIGATRSRSAWEVYYARSALVLHAAAYRLQAIDMVFVDLQDRAGLEEEARLGAQLGFSGKQIIHPAQVEPVQSAYTPSPEAIQHARRLVQTYEEQQAAGKSVFVLDGRMVELPNVQAARRLLERANDEGLPAGNSGR